MVLDSLSELRLLAQTSLRYRRQILALKQSFIGRHCTALFLDDRSNDAILLLRMYEHAGAVRKAISVIKKRSGQHEDTIRQLWFDERGVHLGPPLSIRTASGSSSWRRPGAMPTSPSGC